MAAEATVQLRARKRKKAEFAALVARNKREEANRAVAALAKQKVARDARYASRKKRKA